jgi:myo-inositol-1-phosphate synthase
MLDVAIVGVGNCASSLIQSLELARRGELRFVSQIPLRGGAGVDSIRIVAAFDVDRHKVGRDLADAIFAEPNCTTAYVHPPPTGVQVAPGPLADGLEGPLENLVRPSPECEAATAASVAGALHASGAKVVVLYLPTGAQRAAELYAEAALVSGCCLVNCTPAELACSPEWRRRFRSANLPLIGDDMKSHLGSTTVHQALLALMKERGIVPENTYQLNIGGNTDFLNMRDPRRSRPKRQSKARALAEFLNDDGALGIGPSDFVPFLRDRKVGYIRIEAQGFMGMPVSLEVRLSVEDSPNAAPVALDAIRLAAALRAGHDIDEAACCARLFKRPKAQNGRLTVAPPAGETSPHVRHNDPAARRAAPQQQAVRGGRAERPRPPRYSV